MDDVSKVRVFTRESTGELVQVGCARQDRTRIFKTLDQMSVGLGRMPHLLKKG
jgi:hypothetical protein